MEPTCIRLFQPDDKAALLDLINRVQPHLPWSDAYFAWQYENNPAGKARIWLAEHEGQIVGSYAAVPRMTKPPFGDEVWWRVQDVMTHPAFRKRGIMHRLTAFGTAAILGQSQSSYAFPKEIRATLRCFLRQGWVQTERVPSRRVSVDEARYHRVARCQPPTVLMTAFGEEVSQLWQTVAAAFSFTFARDAAYLTWRYFENPTAQYVPFAVRDGQTLQGVLVMKLYAEPDSRIAHLCELFVSPGNTDALSALLARAVQFAAEHHASALTAWLPAGHPYARAYEAAGFCLDTSLAQWMVVRSPEAPSAFALPESWNLSIGDHDVY